MRRSLAIILWMAIPALAAAALAEDIKMHPPVEHPHAGITLAVPVGFSYQPVDEPYDVCRAVVAENGEPAQAITLSAFAVDDATLAEEFADSMLDEMKENLALRGIKVVKKTPMTVADTPALAVLYTYNYRGIAATAVRVYFLRQLPIGQGKICYVLTVESAVTHASDMMDILGSCIGSVSLIDLKHPARTALGDDTWLIEDHTLCYAFATPRKDHHRG